MLRIALLGCLLLGAFSACDEDHTVPFGLGGDQDGHDEDGADDGTPADDAPELPSGRAIADGTPRVDLEGAPIELDGSIRAIWAHDVDGDGDRDAILVASGPDDAPVRILFVRREGREFLVPRALGAAPAGRGCTIESASIEPVSSSWLEARVHLVCPEPAETRTEIFVLACERTPRRIEHFAILAADTRAPGEMSIALSARDADDDGRPDLVLDVMVDGMVDGTVDVTVDGGLGGSDGQHIELTWVDRPSGLARDGTEPANTLNERSRSALRLLRNERDVALARSREILALHKALCSESGLARLRIGESAGVSCGRSDGAGRAATNVVRGLAARGDLLEAVDAYAHLEDPGQLINDERRQYARRAIGEAPATGGVTLREGPLFVASPGRGVALSSIGFIDETHLALRGLTTQVWSIDSGETSTGAGGRSDVRIVDPSRRFAVAAIERSCRGYELQIVTASGVVGAARVEPARAALLESVPGPGGEACTQIPNAQRDDDGDWTVLGWAPQGILAARRETLRLVPLDVNAQATGDPHDLDPGTPPPAPIAAGRATRDARHWVELRGLGVILHGNAGGVSRLLWPDGWASRDGEPSQAAVAPSGRRVAVLRGGRVILLDLADPPTP